jgi:membrane-bound serine protease (ClpP class)
MNVLLDPNVAYFLLIGGLVLGIIAVFTPGTGIVELGAIFSIALAVYGLVNLPVNSWGLTLVILGFVPFIFSARKQHRKYLIPVSYFLVIVGSLFIFRSEAGIARASIPLLASIAVTALSLLWLFAIKGTEASKKPPSMNLDDLIGQKALALTEIHTEGTIYLNGENWSARSKEPIAVGSELRIISRKGLIMLVEPLDEEISTADNGIKI